MAPSGKPLLRFDRTARSLEARFTELTEKLRQNRPADDVELLRRAYDFAAEQHRSQKRESGEPYLSHPLEVAHVLADMKLDVATVAAALLHDVVEDTQIPLSRIAELFGPVTSRLVEGVTKISRLDLLAPEARQAESLRKMLLAMVNDVRVVVIKLADRLHNMRTLEFLAPEKQQRIARETIDVYAPIAHRLGMGLIRGELEDLAFRTCRLPRIAKSGDLTQQSGGKVPPGSAKRNSRKTGGQWRPRGGRRASEAALLDSPENSAPTAHA